MIEFTHGVASGDPTQDGIVLWTRAIDSDRPGTPIELLCHVSGALGPRSCHVHTDPGRDHTVHAEIDGLVAGDTYTYQFESIDGSVTSTAGRFRTLPDRDAANMSFVVVSCSKYNAGYFNGYSRIAERDEIDFVLHLGDYIYEAANVPAGRQTPGASIGRDVVPLHECRTLEDYRLRYSQYRTDPDLQAVHAAHAFIATIDDHEIADNAWAGGAEEHKESEHGPWNERVVAALQAWEDWMPTRLRPASGDPIHQKIEVGNLVTIFVLEARLHRTAQDLPDSLDKSQLGLEQRTWLTSALPLVKSKWVVIGMPSLFQPFWSDSFDERATSALHTLKIAEPGQRRSFYDMWDSYPSERRLILDALRAAHAGRVVVSGDVHVSVAGDLTVDDDRVAVEWTTASLTSQNLDDKLGWDRRTGSLAAEDSIRSALPGVNYVNLDDHGYAKVVVAEDHASCEWWYTDEVLVPCDTEHLGHVETTRRERFCDPEA